MQCDLAHLVWVNKIIYCTGSCTSLKIGPQKYSEHHKNLCRERGFFCTSYPLVDWVVQGGWRQQLEVELPHGHAGIHSVVVEYTVYCYVLPGSSHHFLGDVAHRCTQERKKKHVILCYVYCLKEEISFLTFYTLKSLLQKTQSQMDVTQMTKTKTLKQIKHMTHSHSPTVAT